MVTIETFLLPKKKTMSIMNMYFHHLRCSAYFLDNDINNMTNCLKFKMAITLICKQYCCHNQLVRISERPNFIRAQLFHKSYGFFYIMVKFCVHYVEVNFIRTMNLNNEQLIKLEIQVFIVHGCTTFPPFSQNFWTDKGKSKYLPSKICKNLHNNFKFN